MSTLPHVRIVASGTLGVGFGNEIWSCSHKLALTAAGAGSVLVAASQLDVDGLAPILGEAWRSLISTGAGAGIQVSPFSDNVQLVSVKASAVVASGLDDPALHPTSVDFAENNRGGAPASGGANFSGSEPYSVALATTFRGSNFLRGAAAYGRTFLPVPNLHYAPTGPAGQMVDGLMAEITTQGFADLVAALLTEANSTVLASGKVVQAANISTSEAAAGVRWQPITSVVVDSRPDTIRRRSNQIGGQGRMTAAVA